MYCTESLIRFHEYGGTLRGRKEKMNYEFKHIIELTGTFDYSDGSEPGNPEPEPP